jgi:hypothetical protein
MLQTLRTSRRLALFTLAAFLVVQPAMACAALCLLDRHAAGAHSSVGPDRNPVLTPSECHHSKTGAVQAVRLPVISPMEPSGAMLIGFVARWTEPVWTLSSAPRFISHSIDPPPPRLA